MRTKHQVRIPDSIHCGGSNNYTQIPNDLLRNPEISSKAKILLCILLSNQDGWCSYVSTISKMMKEQRDAIYAAAAELKSFGYLNQIKYRHKETKQHAGSLWMYTDVPYAFDTEKARTVINKHGFEPIPGPTTYGKAVSGKAVYGEAVSGKSNTKKTQEKKTKEKELSIDNYAPKSVHEVLIDFWNSLPNTRKHTNPETKVYQQASQMLSNLLEGKPIVHNKDDLPTKPLNDFFQKHLLTPKLLHHKWTENEIKEVLKQLPDVYETTSQKTRRDLPGVLWNAFGAGGFSMFYYTADKQHTPLEYQHLAEQYTSVQPCTNTNRLLSWAKDFQIAVERDELVDVVELTHVLRWYKKHHMDKYVPNADDPAEFIQRFQRIKKSMTNKTKQNDDPKRPGLRFTEKSNPIEFKKTIIV